jgi:dipeptidyl aminopeptidase/acylaminoacyl peptidase
MKPLDLAPDAPWRQRFRAPSYLYYMRAELAPERGVVVYNPEGVYQFFAWDVPTNRLRQMTHRPEGFAQGILSPDGRWVYYLDDQHGREIGHFARFPCDGELTPETSVDLTPDLLPFSPAGFGLSRSGNLLMVNTATPSGFDLYGIALHPDDSFDAPRAIFHSDAMAIGPAISPDGQVAVMMTNERSGRPEFNLIALDTRTGQRLAELWDGEHTGLGAVRFSPVPGDMRLLAITNRSGTEQLLTWNPITGARHDLVFEGVAGAVIPADWSTDGRRLLFQSFNQAVQQFYVYDFETGGLTRLDHPAGTYGAVNFSGADEILAMLEDSVLPRRMVALDAHTGMLLREVLPAALAPAGTRWQSISFPSSDGQAVQAWLVRPQGPGPFPTIIEMIGGPGGVKVEGYVPQHQAWVDHGFALLSVNYRGCSSFGKEYQTKIFGNPGYWEVEDIVAARHYLVEQGIADPDAILLTGWSYGGYLTLQTLGLYPDLWAAGMAGIAIADWAVQYEDTADMLRGFQTALLGGTPAMVAEQYSKSSPITYADKVRAPVLIIQGRNDTRTPARPIELYEAKLKSLGKSVEVEWYDTGHLGSFVDTELGIQHQERMLRFAYRVLG